MVKIRVLSSMERTELTALRILQDAADHRPILFYESFNYHAEIPALFQDYGYLVFESDRHRAIVPETSSFISLPNDLHAGCDIRISPTGISDPFAPWISKLRRCRSRSLCRLGTRPKIWRAVLPQSGGPMKFSWSIRKARMDHNASRKSLARGSCNLNSTAPGRRKKTGRWKTFLSATLGFSSSMPTKYCRRKRRQNFGPRSRTPAETDGILDQSPLHVHGPLAAARLLSELESAPLPALVRPIRKADRRRDRERRQRSARARRGARADGPVALRDGSLRLSLGRGFCRETQSLFQLGSAYRRGRTGVHRVRQIAKRARRAATPDQTASRRRLPFRPLLRFLYVYVWQRGFLDGREGYYFARLHGFYEFLSVAKTYELKKHAALRLTMTPGPASTNTALIHQRSRILRQRIASSIRAAKLLWVRS